MNPHDQNSQILSHILITYIKGANSKVFNNKYKIIWTTTEVPHWNGHRYKITRAFDVYSGYFEHDLLDVPIRRSAKSCRS